MQRSTFNKKFSLGLNMESPLNDVEFFLRTNADLIDSVYFSIPLGTKFYSRTELKNSIEGEESEQKLFYLLNVLDELGIKKELAVNTYKLDISDLYDTCTYLKNHNIIPDEIVCLEAYGKVLKKKYPNAEIKYSFNNPTVSDLDDFDTVVVGKEYLRNMEKRHELINQGKNVVLLLNNGCSFNCHYQCGDSKFCNSVLKETLKETTVNEVYANQSFFPEELRDILKYDIYADNYRFKISNRPLSAEYSENVLASYISNKCGKDYICESKINYGLFCTMLQLLKRIDDFDITKIVEYKNSLRIKQFEK